MASLTQEQVDALKSKGLTDQKIAALASKNGYSMPKVSTVSKIGKALIKSERNFGQSIAAASSGALGGTKKNIDLANQMATETQNAMLKRIKEKQARGEDVSRLIGALKTMDKEVNFYDIINESTNNSLNKKGRQVFGEALGVATDILGAGALPGGVGQVAKATSFGKGVVQGAKAGAVGGGVFGVAQGASRAAQENQTAGEIIGSGIRGGIEGALAGGALGGAIGGVAGGIAGRQERLLNKKLDYTLDLVSPKPTEKVIQQAGKEGRLTAPGIISKSKIKPSRQDVLLADAVSDYVPYGAKPTEAVDYITRGIDELDNGVKNMIYQRNVPIEKSSLLNRFEAAKDDVSLIFASDKTAENTYNKVVEAFIKHIKTDDAVGLFEARQSFDKLPAVQKLLNSEALGENTRKEIVSVIRQAVNEQVASILPANNPLKATLLQESRMLKAISNIIQKNASTFDKNKIGLLLDKYPLLKYISYGIGIGAVAKLTGLSTGNQ